MSKRDRHADPFRNLVVLGESTVAGAGASAEANRWVNVVAALLGRFQGQPVILHNKGIGANVISPRSPGYQASAKPSAIERYHTDVMALKPDLFILAYGLNDMRCGMPPQAFRDDMARIIADVRDACHPLIVLTTVYNMSAYDRYPPFDQGSPQAAQWYNLVIGQLADEYDCLLADIWDAQAQAPWNVDADTVHANDLGHWLIGARVFQTIAAHCSGVYRP